MLERTVVLSAERSEMMPWNITSQKMLLCPHVVGGPWAPDRVRMRGR